MHRPTNTRRSRLFGRSIIEQMERRSYLTGIPILSGQTLQGVIATAGQTISYSFAASAGTSVTFSVGDPNSASTYEPHFHIYDPGGNDINNGNSYNAGGATDSSYIARFQVPATGGGNYTVVVDGYGGSNTGSFDVELAEAPASQQPDADNDGGTIVSGQTKAGTINRPGDVDIYTFSAAANNSVTLSVGDPGSTSTYETHFHIYDPSGNDINNGNSYNAGGATNSSYVARFQVPSTGGGTYTAVVDNYSPSAQGTYDVELAEAPANLLPNRSNGGTILSGQTVSGNLTHPGDLGIYTFSAPPGSTATVSVGDTDSADTYQTHFHIYDPSGNDINNGNSYNAGGNSDSSYVARFQAPSTAGGTYTLVIDDYNASIVGAYDIELAVAPASQQPDADSDGGTIVSGQTKTGMINRPGDIDIYTFAASAGASVTFSVGDPSSTSTYETHFHIYDPSGNDINNGNSYNAGGATNSSYVARFQVPSTGGGTYTAVVDNYSSSAQGAYDVELAEAPANLLPNRSNGGVVLSGQTISGNLTHPGDLGIYTFSAPAGGSAVVSVGDPNSTSTYQPHFHVYDPSGNDINNGNSYSAGGNSDSSAIARVAVPTTGGGTYTVVIDDYSASVVGGYDIELAVAPASQQPDADNDGGTIVSGQAKTGAINRPGDLDIYTFAASANNSVMLTVGDSNSTSTYQTLFHVYDPSGNDINNGNAYSTGGNTNSSATARFQVPSTGGGVYTVVVQSYAASSTGDYIITLNGATSSGIAPTVTASQIGTGAVQRSSIKTFSVTFNEPVTLAAGAYTLYKEPLTASGSINTSGTPSDVTAGVSVSNSGSTLTFTTTPGGSLDRTAASSKAGLLANGIYRLVLHGGQITDAATGTASLNGGADLNVSFASAEATGGSSTYFHVLFGDVNGDGKVNLVDYRQFAKDFPSSTASANYDISLDYNADGNINLVDYRQFSADYLMAFSY